MSKNDDDLYSVPTLGQLGKYHSPCKYQAIAQFSYRVLKMNSSFLFSCVHVGFDTHSLPKTAVWPGGETEGLYRLDRHMERKVCY